MKRTLHAIGNLPVILLIAACPLLAQAPLLAVSAPTPRVVHLPDGIVGRSWKALLTNNYTAPVTAYEVAFKKGDGTRGGVMGDDSIPGSVGLHPPLPPGATASIVVPGSSTIANPPAVEVTGVIYADGATAGDPAVVQHFLLVRSVFLSELPQTIARLRVVAADPNPDQATLVAQFQQQANVESSLLRQDGARVHIPARVAGSVAQSFKLNPDGNLQGEAAGLAQMFTKWNLQLNASKPKLQTMAFPSVR